MILLTSFKESRHLDGYDLWSGAVYQPNGFNYPKAAWADIRDEYGRWIRPRNFLDQPRPLEAYRDALWELYIARQAEVEEWIIEAVVLPGEVEPNQPDIALCCWCPYDKAAQRQLGEHGSFVCHTAVMGKFLTERLNSEVQYDRDRERMVRF